MSSSTSAVFTGSSTYSSDFSQVITRAQQIASLPINLLTTQKTTLTSEQSALSGLGSNFSSLQAALLSLNSAATGSTTGVSSSTSTVASATVASGALLGSYSLEVVDPGSQASATSILGVADPSTANISTSASFSLSANGVQYTNIVPTSNTLSGLAQAIQTATKGDVQATIVNMGTAAAPSYRLSLQNTKYGPLDIQLNDGLGGANLLSTATTATSVQYRVNGQPSTGDPLSSDSRSLTLSPNLTVNVLAQGTTNITVTRSTASIVAQISAFVKAYNTTTTALDAQRGTGGGALAGQSIVSTLSESLRDVSGYSGTGSLSSIADLGLTFDQSGTLSFDSSVLTAAAAKDFGAVTDFLGSTTIGGFLKAANDTLNSITDSTSGVIPVQLLSLAGEITATGNKISDDQALVDQMTESLTAQMAAADALIASLQQQASYFTNMFAAMAQNQSAMK